MIPYFDAERKSRFFWLMAFGIFSMLVSLSFFWEGIHSDFSSLCGDQVNIFSICIKKDYPELLQDDFVVGDLKDVEHYIPSFISLVRFFSLPNHNYFRGLNILLLFTTLVYMWGWWRFFLIWGDRWVAASLAFFARGIIWLPAHELWGISSLWSMLPRTLFLALLPWVLWVWFQFRQSQRGWLLTSLLCGFIVNIHPISGFCIVISILLAEFSWSLRESRDLKVAISRLFFGGIIMLIGALATIFTYLSLLGKTKAIDPIEFDKALRLRISPLFIYPGLCFKNWLSQPKLLILVFCPWLLSCLFISHRSLKRYKNAILSLAIFSLGCILAVLLPFSLERIFNFFGYHAHFGFQLIRNGKYIVVPSITLTTLICVLFSRWISGYIRYGRIIVVSVFCSAILLSLFARQPIFNNLPVLGDDVFKFLWPKWSISHPANTQGYELMSALQWIKKNTPKDAKFVGPRLIRIVSQRSIIFDGKAASLLIEGNPHKFIEWAKREQELRKPEYQNPIKKGRLFASWGGEYWMTQAYLPEFSLIYSNSEWYVYGLKGLEISRVLTE